MESNFYYVYYVHPQTDGTVKRQLAGRFMVWRDYLWVLEDHFGLLHSKLQDGWVSAKMQRAIETMQQSAYLDVVTRRQLHGGSRLDLVRDLDDGTPVMDGSEPAQVEPDEEAAEFEYHPAGRPAQKLEAHGEKLVLNGIPLDEAETKYLLETLKSGATVRFPKSVEGVQKSEEMFEDLMKLEPDLAEALNSLRAAAKSGGMEQRHVDALTRTIFEDERVKGMGNKRAYNDFASRPRAGIHIRMDGNDFGSINKVHGFEVGDASISAMGNAMREAMDETVGKKNGKLFRIGGDEFHGFVPTHEHAALFARKMNEKLKAIPAVGGTHQLSMSVGLGADMGAAERALIHAKTAKKVAGYKLGMAKTHVHSLLPGYEGALKVDPELGPSVPPPPEPLTPS